MELTAFTVPPSVALSSTHQASPHDPENFPFVLLGNKIDQGEGKRMVRLGPSHRPILSALD